MDKIASFEQPKGKNRTLYFYSQVNQESIGTLTKEIIEINELDRYLEKYYELHDLIYQPKPIKIIIDSYGGLLYECFGLLSVMESSKTPIHTIVTGAAMSCGFMILISGHRRFGYSLSTPLYHQVSACVRVKAKDIEEEEDSSSEEEEEDEDEDGEEEMNDSDNSESDEDKKQPVNVKSSPKRPRAAVYN